MFVISRVYTKHFYLGKINLPSLFGNGNENVKTQ